jgi:predicted transcriptional regulator
MAVAFAVGYTKNMSIITDPTTVNLHFAHKDRTEIITLMLRSASKENGAFKTRIMYDAFLSFSQVEGYFPLLLRNGLLADGEIKKTYTITGKGSRVLELCDSLSHMIDIRRTNKDEKNNIKARKW